MSEFIQASPGKKKLLELIDDLKPYEEIFIKADNQGKPDIMIIKPI